MIKKLKINFLIIFLFIILLFTPYLILLPKISFDLNWGWSEASLAYCYSLLQAIVSSLASLFFGFFGAMGLVSITSIRKRKILEVFCILPSVLPALFFVTAMLQIVNPFPFGLLGMVLTHVLMNVGLASVFFYFIFINKISALSELSFLEGASRLSFIRNVLGMIKSDALSVFLFFMIKFFVSFSVPLLVGMGVPNLEILIYEKLRISNSMDQAIGLSFFESAMTLVFFFLYRGMTFKNNKRLNPSCLLKLKPGLLLILLPVFIFVLGTFLGLGKGLIYQLHPLSLDIFVSPLMKSLLLSLGTGGFVCALLLIVSYQYQNKIFQRFLASYIPLSTVLFGLSFLLMDLEFLGFLEKDIKTVLALGILFLPPLFRFQLRDKILFLRSQIEEAQIMGASYNLIFIKIVFPQVISEVMFLSGLGAFWAMGDFAISRIIYGSEATLALLTQTFLNSYQVDLASMMSFVLLVIGGIVFYFFRRLGDKLCSQGSV